MSAVEAAPFGLVPGETSSSSSSEDEASLRRSPASAHKRRGSGHVRSSNTTPPRRPGYLRSRRCLTHNDEAVPDSQCCSTAPSPGEINSETTPPSHDQLNAPPKQATPTILLSPVPPVVSPQTETILIFDWDDTLCPSTWLGDNHLTVDDTCLVGPLEAQMLAQMAECSKRLLEVATKLGSVIIVTNAEDGWINLSCRKFLPSLYNYLSGFKQLSARTRYEKQISNCPFTWKLMAFRDEIFAHLGKSKRTKANQNDPCICVVSLGDSVHERLALISLAKSQLGAVVKCRTKSIKLLEHPGIEQLMDEHLLIINMLEGVVNHRDDMDLYIRSLHGGAKKINDAES